MPRKVELKQGSLYTRNGHYYLRAKLPGDDKYRGYALKEKGATRAQTSEPRAIRLANDMIDAAEARQRDEDGDHKVVYVRDLVGIYERKAKVKYGEKSKEMQNMNYALNVIKKVPKVYDKPIDKFVEDDIEKLCYYMGDVLGNTDSTASTRLRYIRRMFNWGYKNGKIEIKPLTTLKEFGEPGPNYGLKESKVVTDADPDHLSIIQKHSTKVLSDMIEFQLRSGVRSDEVCLIKPKNLTYRTKGDKEYWEYRPSDYKGKKTSKKERVIPILPRAHDVLRPYLIRPKTAYCFTPLEHNNQLKAIKHAARKIEDGQGNMPGTNCQNIKVKKAHFDPGSYRLAMKQAFNRAKKAGEEVEWVHPHQLRHSFGTWAKNTIGWEFARVCLGHSERLMTLWYVKEEDERTIFDGIGELKKKNA
jgi:integrase